MSLRLLNHDWMRYWVSRGGSYKLDAQGFLLANDPKSLELFNPCLKSLDSLVEAQCLILLGEPGMGKTTELKKLHESSLPLGQVLLIDLATIHSEYRLWQALFDHAMYQSWIRSNEVLTLILDGFDECQIRIENLTDLLSEQLDKAPTSRLRLRIACRTTDWPSRFEKSLRKHWTERDSSFLALELAPLSLLNVWAACEALDIDSKLFLQEVIEREAVPFAIKPVTLKFLFNLYKCDRYLPTSHTELYRRGCHLLCSEHEQRRRGSESRRNRLDAWQRMAVAERIAATSQLCRSTTIILDTDCADMTEGGLALSDLSGGIEDVQGGSFTVTEHALRDAIETALFSAHGTSSFGFAHKSYSEFLSANYLYRKQMPWAQLSTLILHPDSQRYVIPQLRQMVAWLATMDQGIFWRIVAIDPQLLLQGDVASMGADCRSALVASLLAHFEEGRFTDRDWSLRGRYKNLHHESIADQLRPILKDPSARTYTRRVALDIASACRVEELNPELCKLMLDPTEDSILRRLSAKFVAEVCGAGARLRMRSLLELDAGEDPDDSLKGWALIGLWPDLIQVEEVLSKLTAPRRPSVFDSYRRFLGSEFIEKLEVRGLAKVLEWALTLNLGDRNFDLTPFGNLVEAAMREAMTSLDHEGVRCAFGRLAARMIKHHNFSFRSFGDHNIEKAFDNPTRRHALIEAILPGLVHEGVKPEYLAATPARLVLREDLKWMIGKFCGAKDEPHQAAWAVLIRLAMTDSPDDIEIVHGAVKENCRLDQLIGEQFQPIDLQSDLAIKTRQLYHQMAEVRDRRHRDETEEVQIPIDALLGSLESGELQSWLILADTLSARHSAEHYDSAVESDLSRMSGWQTAPEITRRRIVSGAAKFLQEFEAVDFEWLTTGRLHIPSIGGYRALRLLERFEPQSLNLLTQSAWERWAPIVLGYPCWHERDRLEEHQRMVSLFYRRIPKAVINSLICLIDCENRQEHSQTSMLEKLELCWDARLANALFERVSKGDLNSALASRIFEQLLAKRFEPSENYVISQISTPLPTTVEEQDLALQLAVIALEHSHLNRWSLLQPILSDELEFAKRLLASLAYRERGAPTLLRLADGELGELYFWLATHFPPAEDPFFDDIHTWTAREAIGRFRDSVLYSLQNRGTGEAVEIIRSLERRLPNLQFLTEVVIEANEFMLQQTWIPPYPIEFLAMVRDGYLRLVNSGQQLVDLLIETLNELALELQGETPGAPDLWDEVTPRVFRPKDENRLSDYLTRHFRRSLSCRGVVVNREVVIRRGEKRGSGERTDIQVDAVARSNLSSSFHTITAVVEVKGCWHRELKTAMETQLRGRYLKEARYKHGLYLVGWYKCSAWDDQDRRKHACPFKSMESADAELKIQAEKLSENVSIKSYLLNATLR